MTEYTAASVTEPHFKHNDSRGRDINRRQRYSRRKRFGMIARARRHVPPGVAEGDWELIETVLRVQAQLSETSPAEFAAVVERWLTADEMMDVWSFFAAWVPDGLNFAASAIAASWAQSTRALLENVSRSKRRALYLNLAADAAKLKASIAKAAHSTYSLEELLRSHGDVGRINWDRLLDRLRSQAEADAKSALKFHAMPTKGRNARPRAFVKVFLRVYLEGMKGSGSPLKKPTMRFYKAVAQAAQVTFEEAQDLVSWRYVRDVYKDTANLVR